MQSRNQTDLNSPETTTRRRALIRSHGYIRSLYEHWYRLIQEQLPACAGEILELGSGGGFIEDSIPGVITSEVLSVPGIMHTVDAASLPFGPDSLRAVVGTNVLHHIPSIKRFYKESIRTLAPGGRIIFVEPWPTMWSIPIYRYFHHELFDMKRDWSIPSGGPLTAANGALPWIVYVRDRANFLRSFPELKILFLRPLMPFSYLACGGLERALPLPRFFFHALRRVESFADRLGLFALTVVEKNYA